MKKIILFQLVFFCMLLAFGGCSAAKGIAGKDSVNYPGTVTLNDGQQKTGFFRMPFASDEKLYMYSQINREGAYESIPAEDVAILSLHNASSPGLSSTFKYLMVREKKGNSLKRWVLLLSESDFLTAYVGAPMYQIADNGEVFLVGSKQVINQGPSRGSITINPSFNVYMMKKDDRVPTCVGFRGGISFEASALRVGITRFLEDDPMLCSYIRDQKLGYEQIDQIVELYNPLRGSSPLVVDGVEFSKDNRFLTNRFNKELMYTLEGGKSVSNQAEPIGNQFGPEFGLGIRSSVFKFISYGTDIGVATMKTVDDIKRIENHPMNTIEGGWEDVPVIPEDLVNGAYFRFNTYIGGQLPMDFGKIYVIPAAHITFGGLAGSNYGACNYGPMFNLDFGFTMKNDLIFLIGVGYRHSIPIVKEDTRLPASYPGFNTYGPFNTAFVRIGLSL